MLEISQIDLSDLHWDMQTLLGLSNDISFLLITLFYKNSYIGFVSKTCTLGLLEQKQYYPLSNLYFVFWI